ncbi:hypothetical protein [Streptomyces platensis]|uniref:hypothetical protein n=1 Tax=Streptomyces platensis TaxID=58346 RepID=UPI00331BC520
MELQLTHTDIPSTIQRLLLETADALALADFRNDHRIIRPASMTLALGSTARRLHDVHAIDDMHSTALRMHWKAQQAARWASSRSAAQSTATTRHATALAEKDLADARQHLDEITELVVAAAEAVEADVTAGLSALGDVDGLTEGEVIERIYEITGLNSVPKEPVVRKVGRLPLEVGSPLPGGTTVVTKEGTGGRAWAITDSNGAEWRINKYAELFLHGDGEVEIITPDWANYGS